MRLLFVPAISEWIILALALIVLIDVLRHSFKGANDKLTWVAIVLCMNVLGSILYFIIGRQQRVL